MKTVTPIKIHQLKLKFRNQKSTELKLWKKLQENLRYYSGVVEDTIPIVGDPISKKKGQQKENNEGN